MGSLVASGRFSSVLRWLGLTLVVLLFLQLAAVLVPWSWGEEAFRQIVVERLVNQSPMALVGLLVVLLASRFDHPNASRTPLRWLVTVLSGLLAVALLVSVPVSISGDRALSDQADQALAGKRSQLESARLQSQNPAVIEQVVRQGEQVGQIPPQATEEQKTQAAKSFIERQLSQLDDQIKQSERARDLSVNQRRFGGTGSALVLGVAFTLLALAAVL